MEIQHGRLIISNSITKSLVLFSLNKLSWGLFEEYPTMQISYYGMLERKSQQDPPGITRPQLRAMLSVLSARILANKHSCGCTVRSRSAARQVPALFSFIKVT